MPKYVHKFSRSVSREVEIPHEQPQHGQTMPAINFEWTGKPKKKDLQEYIRWVSGILNAYSKRWGNTLAAGYSGGKRSEHLAGLALLVR